MASVKSIKSAYDVDSKALKNTLEAKITDNLKVGIARGGSAWHRSHAFHSRAQASPLRLCSLYHTVVFARKAALPAWAMSALQGAAPALWVQFCSAATCPRRLRSPTQAQPVERPSTFC